MVTLYDFQETAEEFLSSHPRCILGDEPGVGKSYPAIEAAQKLDGPKLIICPRYVIPNWIKYLGQYNITNFAVVVGSITKKNELLDGDYDWYIITYNMLGQTHNKTARGRDKEAKYTQILRKKWKVVLLDEAHRLRGRKSQWTQSAFKLRADNVWMLTGSPMYRSPQDIWPLLKMCDPKRFRSFWKFVEHYCITRATPFGTDVVGIRHPKVFQTMLSDYMMRRTIDEVGVNLPELLEPRVVTCELTPKVMTQYKQLKKDFRMQNPDSEEFVRVQAMGQAHKLRQLVAKDPNKLSTLQEVLEDVNERVVIFTWFRDSAAAVAEKVGTSMVVTGAIDAFKRHEHFEMLEANPYGRLVATIESMKEGVNLQHTSKVIFYEADWVPESNRQAIGRFYRAGQKKHVQVYHIQAESTLDGKVFEVAERRSKEIDRALTEEFYEDE